MTRDYTPVQETSLLQTDTFGTGEQVSRGEYIVMGNKYPPCR